MFDMFVKERQVSVEDIIQRWQNCGWLSKLFCQIIQWKQLHSASGFCDKWKQYFCQL